MIQEIKMPSAGQTTDEATIASVKVKVGDRVRRGDVLLEAETDKAVLPVESYAAGTVLAVLIEEGDTVSQGTVLVAIGSEGDRYTPAAKAAAPAAPQPQGAPPAKAAAEVSVGTPIRMPNAGQTTDEAVVAALRVKVGDTVKRGDVLMEVETDKAVLPVESYAAGQVFDILVSEGDTVSKGDILLVVGKAEDAGRYSRAAAPEAAEAASWPSGELEGDPEDDYIPIVRGTKPARPAAPAAMRAQPQPAREKAAPAAYPAMPGAKILAKEKGVDLGEVPAANGQFIKRSDVLAYAAAHSPADKGYRVEKMSRMRQVIARRMMESKNTIPDWQATVSVNMEGCMALRDRYKTEKDLRLSYNDILARAIAVAAEEFPLIKARYENGELHVYEHTHIGLAVGLENALLVPVVKDVDTKSLAEISAGYRDVVTRARSGTLRPEDMGCGSITISNLGMFDIDFFTAVVNPPESCILAVGSIRTEPRWDGAAFQPVPIMNITGSFDHKFIDGSYGAQFLKKLKSLLEEPTLILREAEE